MSVPELGQNTARRLYRAATTGGTGSFTLAEDAALRLAQACDTLVAELEAARRGGCRIAEMDGTAGFPDLPTGNALAAGFRGRARQYLETLTALQETALCFKAAYLAAAGKLVEADLAHRAALAVAVRSSSDCHEQDGHG